MSQLIQLILCAAVLLTALGAPMWDAPHARHAALLIELERFQHNPAEPFIENSFLGREAHWVELDGAPPYELVVVRGDYGENIKPDLKLYTYRLTPRGWHEIAPPLPYHPAADITPHYIKNEKRHLLWIDYREDEHAENTPMLLGLDDDRLVNHLRDNLIMPCLKNPSFSYLFDINQDGMDDIVFASIQHDHYKNSLYPGEYEHTSIDKFPCALLNYVVYHHAVDAKIEILMQGEDGRWRSVPAHRHVEGIERLLDELILARTASVEPSWRSPSADLVSQWLEQQSPSAARVERLRQWYELLTLHHKHMQTKPDEDVMWAIVGPDPEPAEEVRGKYARVAMFHNHRWRSLHGERLPRYMR